MKVEHTFKPIYNENSRILILGSIPSVKSRENSFYYGHSKNRFWKVIASIFNESVPEKIKDKTNLILKHNLAIYDVIESCDIEGSSDSSIRNVKLNNISDVIKNSDIKKIIFNGNKAYELYNKYEKNKFENIVCLPSTSPANAKFSFNELVKIWGENIK